ncbi:hypothetical protein [Armatimonas rosea]|uniref:Uncharacterized protein n=1 Tax=Armatimonas rosea TaxID=685828 RepID=A0A7W9SWG9_ARMRO|nr:hypothetical protein [Armatimonas rosea]MBB6053635.1 hypothetical protein [Armatimonas rosea]
MSRLDRRQALLLLTLGISGGCGGTAVPMPTPTPTPSPSPTPTPSPLPTPTPTPRATYFSYTSETGDYIGKGVSRRFERTQGTWWAIASTDGSTIRVFLSQSGEDYFFWDMTFMAPKGQALTVGTYEGAERWPFQTDGHPGLSVVGDGSGCNRVTGRFVIHELTRGTGTTIERLYATFEHHCDGAAPALYGEVSIGAPI